MYQHIRVIKSSSYSTVLDVLLYNVLTIKNFLELRKICVDGWNGSHKVIFSELHGIKSATINRQHFINIDADHLQIFYHMNKIKVHDNFVQWPETESLTFTMEILEWRWNKNIFYQYLNLFIQIEILGRGLELDVKAV